MQPAAAIASVSARIDTLAAKGVEVTESGIATADPPDATPGEMTMIALAETATRTMTDAEVEETDTMRAHLPLAVNANGARRRRPRRGSPRLI